jgi:hypothetical protein
MKTSIYADVVVKANQFPDVVEMQYRCLDNKDRLIGENYRGVFFTWGEARFRYSIDATLVAKCERYFREGHSVSIGYKHVAGRFYGEGESPAVTVKENAKNRGTVYSA